MKKMFLIAITSKIVILSIVLLFIIILASANVGFTWTVTCTATETINENVNTITNWHFDGLSSWSQSGSIKTWPSAWSNWHGGGYWGTGKISQSVALSSKAKYLAWSVCPSCFCNDFFNLEPCGPEQWGARISAKINGNYLANNENPPAGKTTYTWDIGSYAGQTVNIELWLVSAAGQWSGIGSDWVQIQDASGNTVSTITSTRTASDSGSGSVTVGEQDKNMGPFNAIPQPQLGGTISGISCSIADNSNQVKTWIDYPSSTNVYSCLDINSNNACDYTEEQDANCDICIAAGQKFDTTGGACSGATDFAWESGLNPYCCGDDANEYYDGAGICDGTHACCNSASDYIVNGECVSSCCECSSGVCCDGCHFYSSGTSCGTKDCDVNNYYFDSGSDSESGTNYCMYRDYDDCTKTCDSSGGCQDCSCSSYSDSTIATCGTCAYCSGSACSYYSSSTQGPTADGCYSGTYKDYHCTGNSAAETYDDIITDSDGDGYDTECDNDCEDDNADMYPGNEEVCDGLDNDCSDSVDDGLTAPLCENQIGVCSGSTKTCGGNSGWLACDATNYIAANLNYEAEETSCDILDNDCDGSVDEGCTCTPTGSTEQCGTTDAGACEYGTRTCIGGAWGECVGNIEPITELCNVIDDDCDSAVDEDDVCSPTIANIPNINFDEGMHNDTIDLDDHVSDPDNTNAEITWAYSGNTNININIDNNNIVNFTALDNWNGQETITFTATDPNSLSDSDSVIVTVNSINNLPYFVEGLNDQSATEDLLFTYDVNCSDIDIPYGDIITYSIDDPRLNINSDGLITWTPLNPDVGNFPIEVRCSDSILSDTTQTFYITVTAVNDAPTISSVPELNLTEDISYELNLTHYINDVDNTLDYLVIYENSPYATVNNKIITFTYPTPINEDVKITVSDNEFNASQTIKVNVIAVNDAPKFDLNTQKAFTILQGETLNYQFAATDEENDKITYSDNTTLFDINTDAGLISFTPSAVLSGTFSIRITATDDKGANSSIVISLTVTDQNFPPIITSFTPEDLILKPEADYEYDFKYTANDPDGTIPSSLWYLDNKLVSSNQTYRYMPTEEDLGYHNMTLIISDGLLNDSLTWGIEVIPPNHAPILVSNIPDQQLDKNNKKENAFDLDNFFNDPDGTSLVYSVSGNKNISIIIDLIDHTVNIAPDDNWYGTEYVMFVANDGNLIAYSNNIALSVTSMGATICGNNIKELGEQCDGTDNSTCGIYSCKTDCTCNTETCTPNWDCSAWSSCSINSQQTKTCRDLNNCGTNIGKPDETQSCTYTPTCTDGAQNQDEEGVDCGGPCPPCTPGLSPKRKFMWLWFLIPFILIVLIVGALVAGTHRKAKKETTIKKKNMITKAYHHNTLEQQKERELQHYIEVMLSKGFSEDSIKKRLKQEGWPQITLGKIFGRISSYKKAEIKKPIMHRMLIEKKKKIREKEIKAIAQAFEK